MPLRARAWRLTAALLLLLAAVVTVVLWRVPSYSGAGEVLLRAAAGVAVVGLLVAGWLAARVATTGPALGRELELPLVALDETPPAPPGPAPAAAGAASGEPPRIASTSSDATAEGGRWEELRRAVAVAGASIAPVLLVLVLVPTGRSTPQDSAQQRSTVTLTLGTPQPSAGTSGTSATSSMPPTPRPTATPPTPTVTPTPPAPTPAACATSYVVHPGDTLWRIAAQRLPVGASGPQVDRLWRRVYALNRSAVGVDPGRLRIGQPLRLPC